ncbi:response regulator [Algihabitans albus]|uniref:response regulator n=1 Tax=Algihabitans albus TaxID=2164067 RepID=UPI0035CEBBBB
MKSCLVVDDSKVVRMVARRILEGLNFAVDEAADGQQALDRCLEQMPDAVLLDWNMPVMSGIEFLRELRGLADAQQPVVVFCTTENDLSHIQEAMSAGANEYIMKPFDSEILESKFQQTGVL